MKTIILSNGLPTFIDDEDFEFFNRFNWHYAKGYVRKGKYFLHRALLYAEKGDQVDHIDHNPLNNQKSNLRLVRSIDNAHNQSLSSINKSGFCGVSFHKTLNKWQAMIKVNYTQIFLGNFDKKEDAIKAREVADIRYKFHRNHGKNLPKINTEKIPFEKKVVSNVKEKFIHLETRKNHTRYKVSIFISKGKTLYIGSFPTLELAKAARDSYLKTHYHYEK